MQYINLFRLIFSSYCSKVVFVIITLEVVLFVSICIDLHHHHQNNYCYFYPDIGIVLGNMYLGESKSQRSEAINAIKTSIAECKSSYLPLLIQGADSLNQV